MPKVTVIPPSINRTTRQSTTTPTRRKVAAYARVSTDFEEQLTSYEAQISYYTNYIQRNPDWEFVKIYTDEGISATSTKHREGFNSMIADALDGKIDLIITKSVSRFARNTVDSLTTIRKLKEHHVECFFEKENIWTFDSKGELLITIIALSRKMLHGDSENDLLMEKSACRMHTFWAIGKAKMVCRRLFRRRRRRFDTFISDSLTV